MQNKDLTYYIKCFSSLHTNMRYGKPAPHKALLLLAVIDLIESGEIVSNKIILDKTIENQFTCICKALLGDSVIFQPKINYPFYHMRTESFWHLIGYSGSKVEDLSNCSIANLHRNIAFVKLDEDLFSLLQDGNARAKLRVCLITKYLNNQPTVVDPSLNNIALLMACLSYFVA